MKNPIGTLFDHDIQDVAHGVDPYNIDLDVRVKVFACGIALIGSVEDPLYWETSGNLYYGIRK